MNHSFQSRNSVQHQWIHWLRHFLLSLKSPKVSFKESTFSPTMSRHKFSFNLFFKQLWILLWKSLITRRVHYLTTLFELLGPILLVFLGAYLHSKTLGTLNEAVFHPDNHVLHKLGPVIYRNPQFSIHFDPSLDFPYKDFEIVYAPNDASVAQLFSDFSDPIKISSVADYDTLVSRVTEDPRPKSKFGVYVSKNDLSKGQLEYEIVKASDLQSSEIPSITNPFPRKFGQSPVNHTLFAYNQLLPLLSYLNSRHVQSFCQNQKGIPQDCNQLQKVVKMYQMPYPTYQESKSSVASSYVVFGLLITISYFMICPLIVKRITDEKNTKARELLRLIGLSDMVYWLSHFISYLIIFCIHAIGFYFILFHYNPIFKHTSATVFLFGFILFGFQTILFSMLITTVFNRPVIAVIVTLIVWMASTAMIANAFNKSAIPQDKPSPSAMLRSMASLSPTGSFMLFNSIIGEFEDLNIGLTWSNLATKTLGYGSFTALTIILACIISFFLYIVLIWYIDNVWPFQYGVPKSPIFFLKPSYWVASTSRGETLPQTDLDKDFFEPEPVNLKPSIQLQCVSKDFRNLFSSSKLAVDNVWSSIYENQLTVLLGHNGAGKSTTMNMITGMYKPSSGSVFVDSYNVATQTKAARRSIGLCPQENIYFKELTVYEHLKLFAILKNHDFNSVNEEIAKILDLVQLRDKSSCRAANLSGGMKRKLCLGIALIANTQILILDEPTSGLDPEARRIIWDLLISIRRQRTILLTTHYMEEADVLADRIMIMSNGKIVCSGTPLFLKNSFGTGYQLRVASGSGYDSKRFLHFLQRHISSTTLRSEVETESIFTFNQKTTDKSFSAKLEPLFLDIEKNKKALCINSVGLSYSSLEDVFLRVGPDSMAHDSNFHDQVDSANSGQEQNKTKINLSPKSQMLSGSQLTTNQILALFFKRFHFGRRYWPMFIFQLLIPSFIVFVAMLINSKINFSELLKVTLDLDLKELYGTHTETFYNGLKDFEEPFRRLNEDKYEAIVNSSKPSGTDMDHWILGSVSTLENYIKSHIYGLEIDADTFKPWFNAEQTHSILLSLNALYETLLRSISPSSESYIENKLHVIAVQLNSNVSSVDEARIVKSVISWVITCLVILPIAFPFLAASYVLQPIQEKCSKMKLLQLMTGLSPIIYWLVNFIFDLIYHLFAVAILLAIIFLSDTDQTFLAANSASFLFVILFAYGFSIIPFVYILSNLFSKPSTGFVTIVITLFLFGFIANLGMSIVNIFVVHFDFSMLDSSAAPFLWIFRFIPIFSMLFGYQKLFQLSTLQSLCKSMNNKTRESVCGPSGKGGPMAILKGCCQNSCEDKCFMDQSPYSFNQYGSGIELLFLFVTGIAYFMIVILFESYGQIVWNFLSTRVQRLINRNNYISEEPQAEDSDVYEERQLIEHAISSNNFTDLLFVHDLTKKFGYRTAVNQISFSVRHDECFGLLGVNGAGKTTTFGMLTGDLLPTTGDAYILKGRYSLLNNLREFRHNIGYCPQFDAVLDRLSGRETLNIFGLLRGLPRGQLKRNVDTLIDLVGLKQYADNQIETYSGGNKRKLSIAISMIGTPALLFLDEPTAGVDPVARRKIWDLLALIKHSFQVSMVLTSHSMEECEALCSRIAIMVNGTFRCLGSTQHLRSKYGQGYSILIRLKRDESRSDQYIKNVEDDLVSRIPSAVLKDFHQNLLQYHVTDVSEKWSNIFRNLIIIDQKFDFEDYIVSDTTLESIFILFARGQTN